MAKTHYLFMDSKDFVAKKFTLIGDSSRRIARPKHQAVNDFLATDGRSQTLTDEGKSTDMLKEEEITYRIRGAVFEVNKVLGAGFLESVYQKALEFELKQRGLQVQAEVPVSVFYKGQIVGKHRMDLMINDSVVMELKAQQRLPISAEPQLINYLKATGKSVGMLVNFTFPKAVIKRIVL